METIKRRVYTDFLVPTMSFITGMGSVFNLGGHYYEYNSSETGKEADERAITKDWERVGQDFQDVLEEDDLIETF